MASSFYDVNYDVITTIYSFATGHSVSMVSMTKLSCDYRQTSGRRQLKTLLTIDERGSKIDRNSAFNCHLAPVGQQMAIKNSVSKDYCPTFVDGINVFDCRLPCVRHIISDCKEIVEEIEIL